MDKACNGRVEIPTRRDRFYKGKVLIIIWKDYDAGRWYSFVMVFNTSINVLVKRDILEAPGKICNSLFTQLPLWRKLCFSVGSLKSSSFCTPNGCAWVDQHWLHSNWSPPRIHEVHSIANLSVVTTILFRVNVSDQVRHVEVRQWSGEGWCCPQSVPGHRRTSEYAHSMSNSERGDLERHASCKICKNAPP